MTEQENTEDAPYQVLARKYRPTDFSGLIGQETLVQTLSNAIKQSRLAHAFVLTGVRGIGKTTTARIIARALNCDGEGRDGPTVDPCGVCEQCQAINQDRHMDVLEMDAASRTGVDDIRELIEGVRYKPTSARYKVYIIDEVHMLSRNAFNALLKTLEEPPEHVKFIFATTEIGKIPVTVLSRCQRFDLRRIDMDQLSAHFKSIITQEGAALSDEAVHLISRAADGSVRDGLSLLDQAIAHNADGEITADHIRDMLGLADRSQTFELIEAVMKGEIAEALEMMGALYVAGADPAVLLEDMLEITHWVTRIKIVPGVADEPGVPEIERVQGKIMAEGLSMAALSRAWQMLMKGLGEVRMAPRPEQAAEMVLVRLAYAADLPTPADAIKAIKEGSLGNSGGSAPAPAAPSSPAPQTSAIATSPPSNDQPGAALATAAPETVMEVAPQVEPEPDARPNPQSFLDVVALADAEKEAILHANLINNVHLVSFEKGRIEIRPTDHAPPELSGQLREFLTNTTGERWAVTVSNQPGEPTLQQNVNEAVAKTKAEAREHPLVKEILETFPGATIDEVRETKPKK
ncbi:MAG: DNA polymerase III subunit gamma/tau [Rhodospirillaceae bacterium]|jgi:DNA polymerase III subunit gamma/tau|nr:DNA polymerase III subunit gamma/tau [Rhodospirillaceae bacterium]MBT6220496.1 DNA polymerase III subunit gamma/tau [Rhodospirillaceae bacterium]